jgi:uncharacterized protein (TIGR02145 family)
LTASIAVTQAALEQGPETGKPAMWQPIAVPPTYSKTGMYLDISADATAETWASKWFLHDYITYELTIASAGTVTMRATKDRFVFRAFTDKETATAVSRNGGDGDDMTFPAVAGKYYLVIVSYAYWASLNGGGEYLENDIEVGFEISFIPSGDPEESTMQNFVVPNGAAVGDTWEVKDARDDQVYSLVKMIDGNVWMSKNLNYTTGLNDLGDMTNETPGVNAGFTSANSYACQDGHCDRWGAHYPQATAKTVCPSGWRLPTIAEWVGLRDALGGGATAVAALAMPNDEGNVGYKYWSWDNGQTNSTKFNGVGSGSIGQGLGYMHFLNIARFWSEDDRNIFEFGNGGGYITDERNDSMFAVRCVKD